MRRLKAFLVGAVGVGAVGAAVAAAWPVKPAGEVGPPALEAPALVELGEQEHGSVADARFTLRNTGKSELLLTGFRTDCSCNALETEVGGRFATLKELRLAGGEAAQVRLRKSVRGTAGEPIHSVILFRTNVPARPDAAVRVKVDKVLAGVSASPAQWALGSVPQGRATRQEFTLSDSVVPARSVERVESSNPRLRASLNPAGTLVVEVDTAQPGPVDGSVRLFVRGGKADPDPILITGKVVAPVECSPSDIRLPRQSSAGLLYTATYLVRATGGQSLDLRLCDVPEGVKASVEPGSDGPHRVVTVTADPQLSPGRRTVRLTATAGDWTGPVELALDIAPLEGP